MISHFQPVYPVNPLLQPYIYCYYTVNGTSPHFHSKHYSFPHTYNAVSLYRGADISSSDGNLKVSGNGSVSLACVLQGKRQYPLLVEMSGVFSRITILFKPLGLNHFMDQPLSTVMGAAPSLFTAWGLPDEIWDGDCEQQIGRLETFLCGFYRPLNQPALQQALVLLDNQVLLAAIFKRRGYPGYDVVGQEGAHDFWLMVQHCDHHSDFQLEVLEAMKKEVDRHNADGKDYAYLTDRVALNTGHKQLYGTQVTYDLKICRAYPRPVADSVGLNERRKAVGMPLVEVYLNQISELHFEMNKAFYEAKGIKAAQLYPIPAEKN
jgi:hypothetical protein